MNKLIFNVKLNSHIEIIYVIQYGKVGTPQLINQTALVENVQHSFEVVLYQITSRSNLMLFVSVTANDNPYLQFFWNGRE